MGSATSKDHRRQRPMRYRSSATCDFATGVLSDQFLPHRLLARLRLQGSCNLIEIL